MDSLDVATRANVVIGLIAVAGSIIGALWGARVGARATREATQQEIEANRAAAREDDEQQRTAVRLLVSLEIDHNLANLRTHWAEVTKGRPRKYSGPPEIQRRDRSSDYARALLRAPLPPWTRSAWDGLTPLLPLALSRAEIEQANRVYSHLDAITVIRSELAEMAAEKPYQVVMDAPGQLRPIPHTIFPRSFFEYAPALGERVETTVADLLANGNPFSVKIEGKGGATEAAPFVNPRV